jgi:hypothetical protein
MKLLLVISALAGLAATSQLGPFMMPKDYRRQLIGRYCPNVDESSCELKAGDWRGNLGPHPEAGCRHKTAKKYSLPTHYPRPPVHATEKLIMFSSGPGSGGTKVCSGAYIT